MFKLHKEFFKPEAKERVGPSKPNGRLLRRPVVFEFIIAEQRSLLSGRELDGATRYFQLSIAIGRNVNCVSSITKWLLPWATPRHGSHFSSCNKIGLWDCSKHDRNLLQPFMKIHQLLYLLFLPKKRAG